MQKPESVLENETYEYFRDSEIQADHPFPMRRSDLVIGTKIQTDHPYSARI